MQWISNFKLASLGNCMNAILHKKFFKRQKTANIIYISSRYYTELCLNMNWILCINVHQHLGNQDFFFTLHGKPDVKFVHPKIRYLCKNWLKKVCEGHYVLICNLQLKEFKYNETKYIVFLCTVTLICIFL